MGLDLPRQTLAAWPIRLGRFVQPLIDLLHDDLLARALILANEARLQVLREAGRAAQREQAGSYRRSMMTIYRLTGKS